MVNGPAASPSETLTRPKPCSSSPPDFNYFSTETQSNSNKNNNSNSQQQRVPFGSRFTAESRNAAALSYYQHPALRGCHPFSLELAVHGHNNNNNSNNRSGVSDIGSRPGKRKHHQSHYHHHHHQGAHQRDMAGDSGDSDVEVTVDISVDEEYDSDREIDLSLKPDVNRLARPDSAGEEKLSPSSDMDNSSASSSESLEHLKGQSSIHSDRFYFWNTEQHTIASMSFHSLDLALLDL